MKQIQGTNFGNWLVLEKWMEPEMFEGTGAEDEIWLGRKLPADQLSAKLKEHRDTYITEDDFALVAKHGLNLVRIPVPFFVFGDRPPFPGCVEYLDKAFDWAEKYGLEILLDLHTVPGSQNGYDNGGLTGVCKWCKNPIEVEFALSVLERLAQRYGTRKGLYGIEVLNEPISWIVYISAPSTGKAEDKEEAKGSGYVPLSFLKPFYLDAYKRLRAILPDEKTIVFHDGFRLTSWNKFFDDNKMKNVALDTHIYIFAMEIFVPFPMLGIYKLFVNYNKRMLQSVAKHVPVIVGEWCISNKYAVNYGKGQAQTPEVLEEKKKRFHEVVKLQLDAWSVSAGHIYWNYQLLRDKEKPMDEEWKESWDLTRCWKNGWIPENF